METQTAVSFSSSPPPPPWIELPEELTANILQRLSVSDRLKSAGKVCITWRRVCNDPAMWRVVHLSNRDGWRSNKRSWQARRAADLSQGQLVELRIDHFGDDQLLYDIADRASHLRHLTLEHCSSISSHALALSIEKLPRLEALHLILLGSLKSKHVETIGVSCPMLKSFTLYEKSRRHISYESTDNEHVSVLEHCHHAPAVATTMPNLVHLRLVNVCMNNEGLEAILDGCPHLESLDLRGCYPLDLRGELGKRCSEQVKYLKRVADRLSDFEYIDSEDFDYDSDRSSGSSDDIGDAFA